MAGETSLEEADAIRKIGSVGKPNFYVEARLQDDAGRCLLGAASGELLLRGPVATPGYWASPEETSKLFVDGWLRRPKAKQIQAHMFL